MSYYVLAEFVEKCLMCPFSGEKLVKDDDRGGFLSKASNIFYPEKDFGPDITKSNAVLSEGK